MMAEVVGCLRLGSGWLVMKRLTDEVVRLWVGVLGVGTENVTSMMKFNNFV